MDKLIALAIVRAADTIGGLEVGVREGYSGRGMFGNGETAVTFESRSDLMRCVALAAVQVQEDETQRCDLAEDEVAPGDLGLTLDTFLDGLDFEYDTMGRSGSVAY
jgi:hypothetical protein